MRGVRGVAVLTAVLVLAGCSATEVPDRGIDRGIDLVVSPHPDDELEAWSLVDDEQYTVFLTMTHGEATVNCSPAEVARNTQTAWGEDEPDPVPQGPGTPSCAQARIGSWNAFLDAATGITGLQSRVAEIAGHDAQLWWSDTQARVAVDGGDGQLTPEVVTRAVADVLALRGDALPDADVRQVVGAAYTNDPPARGDDAYALYRHPDHWAVRDALLALDEPACVATWPTDPAATRHERVDEATYEQFTALGEEVEPGNPESVRRTGSFQRIYGWLAFPRSYWTPTDLPVPDADGQPLVMAQEQTFTCN
ncbi:hypothetical protein [Kineococcus sp. SYSU DK003]|uniref:hypothetical protein n=1 Tax=Kineococcus sp. SYSU DK003 TaxID=3383124 RepID=UPI003D7E809F